MKEKLIRRAAMKYREWMVSQAQTPVNNSRNNILEQLRTVSDKAIQMEKWAERFFIGATPRIQRSSWDNASHVGIVNQSVYDRIATDMIPDIGNDIITTTRYATAILQKTARQKTVEPLSSKDAIDEVRIVANGWPEVDFRGNVLSVMIRDVVLKDDTEEVELGHFWIHVNLTSPIDGLRIESISSVESESGYTHPHVSSGRLCIGQGDLLSQDALCQGRLEDYFRIVEAVLRTYNGRSPHEKLRGWYNPDHEDQSFCDGCEEWRSNDISSYCEGCQTASCDFCDTDGECCIECSSWFCKNCITTCESCQETTCYNCLTTCCGCGNTFCSGCLSDCVICGESRCDECKSACANCGDSICENCRVVCECCGNECCTTCVDEVCSMCDRNICRECQTTCNDCNKTICNECDDNSCEHCGVSMCSSCVSEHNCLLEEVKDV